MGKKAKEEEESGFGKMLATVVVLGIVFSAGLITGQRLLRAESRAPMVALSTTKDAPKPPTANENAPSLRTTFSFYEHLTTTAEATSPPAQPRAEPAPPKPRAEPEKKLDEKPAEPPKPAADAPTPEASAPVPVAQILDEVVDALGGTAAPAADVAPAPLPARYTLQVSSHPDRESAERETARLDKMGVEPHVVVVDVPGKGQLFRVRVGKFHTMDEARDFQGAIKSTRGVAGFVTPL